VLLNRSHPYHDLVVVLGAEDKRLFDGIDGRRSIVSIMDQAGEAELPRARALFEKLWWYDQVVVDASSAAGVRAATGESAP